MREQEAQRSGPSSLMMMLKDPARASS